MRSLSTLLFLFLSALCLAQATYDQAEKAFLAGKQKHALQILNERIADAPNASDYLLRALIHEQQELYSNANDDFVSAIRLDEEYFEAYFHYSEFLMDTNENEKAVECLSFLLNKLDQGETKGVFFKRDENGQEPIQVRSLSTMESEILMNRGLAYKNLEMYDRSLADMNAAINLDGSAGNLVNRALLHVTAENHSEAKKDLKQALVTSPQHSLAWYNLFVLDKETILPEGLLSANDFGPLLSVRAVESFEQGNYDEASRFFDKALELTPNDVSTLLNAGRLDFRLGDLEKASTKFESVIQIDPTRKEALYLLGNVNFGQGKFQDALELYNSYLMTDPTNSAVWFNSGMSFLELEDAENACLCLTRASEFGLTRADQFIKQYCTTE